MKVYGARVTTKGQVTIPKGVRDDLGIEAGDEVTFSEGERQAYVIKRRRKKSPFSEWRGYLKHLKGKDIDKLVDDMRGR